MLTALALGASTAIVNAQDTNSALGAPGPRGPGMNGHRPPVPAIVAALDANHDGVIDAQEIANASAAASAAMPSCFMIGSLPCRLKRPPRC